MAKKMKVWVGDVSKSRFTVAHVVYGEAQPMQSRAGCLVDFGGDHHERVFTESEVRAIMQRMEESAEANMRTSAQFLGHREVDESVVHDLIDEACKAFGIVLDPA